MLEIEVAYITLTPEQLGLLRALSKKEIVLDGNGNLPYEDRNFTLSLLDFMKLGLVVPVHRVFLVPEALEVVQATSDLTLPVLTALVNAEVEMARAANQQRELEGLAPAYTAENMLPATKALHKLAMSRGLFN